MPNSISFPFSIKVLSSPVLLLTVHFVQRHTIYSYLWVSSILTSVIVMCFDELNIGLVKKEATKMGFTHCSCMFIILFNTDLGRSVLSTYSFGKPAFCFSMLFVFSAYSKFQFYHHKLYNIYMIIVFIGISMEL